MKKRAIWVLFSFIVAVSILLAVCAKEAAYAQGNWWDKFGTPKYGGTITFASNVMGDSFDPYDIAMRPNVLAYEQLFMGDLTIDRNIYSFKTSASPPKINGLLAKSWEWTDPQTLVVHLREGVKWQNKAPVNGREFLADDVVYNFNRLLGRVEGYTEPNPMGIHFLEPIASVNATDKYTLVYKFKAPTQVVNWWCVIDPGNTSMIVPREQAETGNPGDVANAVGTGAFIASAHTSKSSITWAKNPDYYLDDERYPGNRLPYVDAVKQLYIADRATALAALRSGQVDYLDNISWQNANQLKKTNPDILLTAIPSMGEGCDMREDKKPFDDIRVRKALQMAINTPAIAKTIYGGYVSGDPPPYLADTPDYAGWSRPYKEWPADLQQEYSYNPTEAKKLLAEAGYPDGFDTNILVRSNKNIELYEIIKAEFAEIGVNMEIRTMDAPQWMAYIIAGKHDQMFDSFYTSQIFPIHVAYLNRTSKSRQNAIFAPAAYAAAYDNLYEQFLAALSEDAAKALAIQMEELIYRQHWAIVTTSSVSFTGAQASLKGYSGENVNGVPGTIGWYYPRFWKSK